MFVAETTVPVLDPGRGHTKTGQLWAYARDDRPWGGDDPPMVAYIYASDRKGKRAEAHLADFSGILQVGLWRLRRAGQASAADSSRVLLGGLSGVRFYLERLGAYAAGMPDFVVPESR